MSTNPSTLFLALFLAMASNLSALAQIHVESMKLFVQDMNGQLINVYDIRTESLIKSMNIGDKITRTQFSADQSAFYALGVQSLSIIDVSSLEIKTIRLFSDDEAYRYIDGNPNRFQKVFPLGISDSGIAVYLNGKSYIVFDAHQGGKKVNTYTSDSGTGCHLQGNLYIAGQDGIVRVIDPLSGAEKDRLSSVFEAKALSEARQNSTYDDKHINLNLNPSENFLISTVYLGSSDGSSWQGIYDPIAREIVYSERVPQFEYLKRLPMSGMSSHRLFTRSEQLDPNAKLPEYPTMPASPDFDKLKVRDMQKAVDDFKVKSDAYTVRMKEVTAVRQEFANPKNYRVRIYSDIGCTQEVMHVDGTQYAAIYGDLVWVMKDTVSEIYDIRTKQLLYTIYLV